MNCEPTCGEATLNMSENLMKEVETLNEIEEIISDLEIIVAGNSREAVEKRQEPAGMIQNIDMILSKTRATRNRLADLKSVF